MNIRSSQARAAYWSVSRLPDRLSASPAAPRPRAQVALLWRSARESGNLHCHRNALREKPGGQGVRQFYSVEHRRAPRGRTIAKARGRYLKKVALHSPQGHRSECYGFFPATSNRVSALCNAPKVRSTSTLGSPLVRRCSARALALRARSTSISEGRSAVSASIVTLSGNTSAKPQAKPPGSRSCREFALPSPPCPPLSFPA